MKYKGEKLKKIREQKRLTMQEVADGVKVTKTTVLYWENEETTPRAPTLGKLADFFGVEPNYFFDA